MIVDVNHYLTFTIILTILSDKDQEQSRIARLKDNADDPDIFTFYPAPVDPATVLWSWQVKDSKKSFFTEHYAADAILDAGKLGSYAAAGGSVISYNPDIIRWRTHRMGWEENLWPEWKIISEIGSGSYGKVYKVMRQEGSYVSEDALKVISIPRNEEEMEALRRKNMSSKEISEYFYSVKGKFTQEFTLMSTLKGNSNIVSYENHKFVPRQKGVGYDILILMELLTPLKDLYPDLSCSQEEVYKIGIDMCSALELCEQEGVIHRDIKPANIFVSKHGNYKLGDFGIAKVMHGEESHAEVAGTYNYMAPEVYNKQKYDYTVDIYSLGLVLFRLLNDGRGPFLPASSTGITSEMEKEAGLRRLKNREWIPAPRNASVALAEVISKACAYEASERYQSAEEFKQALIECRDGKPNPWEKGPRRKAKKPPVEPVTPVKPAMDWFYKPNKL